MVDERARIRSLAVDVGLFLYVSRTISIEQVRAVKIVREISFTWLAYCVDVDENNVKEQYASRWRK